MKSQAREGLRLSSKIASAFAAATLALAMVPAMAFAADATSGTLVKNADVVYVQAESTTDLDDWIHAEGVIGGEAHIDYKLTAGTGNITVNKHTGVVTGIAAGTTATVTAYLTPGETPSKIPSNPCYEGTLATETIQVDVVDQDATEAGYQGIGFQMKVDGATRAGVNTDTTPTTYTNNVSITPVAGESYALVTLYQNAGLNQYLSSYAAWDKGSAVEAYKAYAGQHITYSNPAGDESIVLEESVDEDNFDVESVTASYVVLKVPASNGTLRVDSALHTFSKVGTTLDPSTTNKSLGVNINYALSIS